MPFSTHTRCAKKDGFLAISKFLDESDIHSRLQSRRETVNTSSIIVRAINVRALRFNLGIGCFLFCFVCFFVFTISAIIDFTNRVHLFLFWPWSISLPCCLNLDHSFRQLMANSIKLV